MFCSDPRERVDSSCIFDSKRQLITQFVLFNQVENVKTRFMSVCIVTFGHYVLCLNMLLTDIKMCVVNAMI